MSVFVLLLLSVIFHVVICLSIPRLRGQWIKQMSIQVTLPVGAVMVFAIIAAASVWMTCAFLEWMAFPMWALVACWSAAEGVTLWVMWEASKS